MRYGSKESMLAKFSPDRQAQFSQFPERCITGDCPTLSEVTRMYGVATAEAWLEIQLRDLSEYSGAKEKLRIEQLAESARIIYASRFWLKLSEVMLFFSQMKGGRYGKFYGAVDPMMISSALREFDRYRSGVIEAADQRERQRRSEAEREGCCSREEYDRMKTVEIPIRIIRDSPELRKDLKPYDVNLNGKAFIRIPKRRMKDVLHYVDSKQIHILH